MSTSWHFSCWQNCQALDKIVKALDKIVKALDKNVKALDKLSRLLILSNKQIILNSDCFFFRNYIKYQKKNLYLPIPCSIFIQIENPFKLKLLGTPWCDFLRKNPENWEKFVNSKLSTDSWHFCQEPWQILVANFFLNFEGFFLRNHIREYPGA